MKFEVRNEHRRRAAATARAHLLKLLVYIRLFADVVVCSERMGICGVAYGHSVGSTDATNWSLVSSDIYFMIVI